MQHLQPQHNPFLRQANAFGHARVGKSQAAADLVLAFKHPLNTALTMAASLAQIGKLSFILAGLGVSLGLLAQPGHSLILAGALIAIARNPLLVAGVSPLVS